MLRIKYGSPVEDIVEKIAYGLSLVDHIEFPIEQEKFTVMDRQIFAMILACLAQINTSSPDSAKKINVCFHVCNGSFELYKDFQSACPKWTSQLYNVGQKVFIKAKHIKGNQIQQTQEAMFPHTDCLMKADIKLRDMERMEFKTVKQNPVTLRELNQKLTKEKCLAKLRLINL